jgi:hypothetical protein
MQKESPTPNNPKPPPRPVAKPFGMTLATSLRLKSENPPSTIEGFESKPAEPSLGGPSFSE